MNRELGELLQQHNLPTGKNWRKPVDNYLRKKERKICAEGENYFIKNLVTGEKIGNLVFSTIGYAYIVALKDSNPKAISVAY
jgi:hypothetical protein